MTDRNEDLPQRVAGAVVERRELLAGLLLAGTLATHEGLVVPTARAAPAPQPSPAPQAAVAAPDPVAAWLVLNDTAAQFVTSVVDVLIPADDLSPSASALGVVTFIDRQLASAWGAGAGMYRMGPFHPGTPEQGDQIPLPPRDFILAGIAAVQAWVLTSTGRHFADLTPVARIDALKQLEKGHAPLDGVDGRAWFDAVLQITMEGFFADPQYGGNRHMAGWRMIGFPGLPAFYAGQITPNLGKRYAPAPQSIADFL